MPTYEVGDFVKAEFMDERTLESEWMWILVDSCDDANRLLFGQLESAPLLEHGRNLGPGSRLAITFDKIREHKKPWEFRRTSQTTEGNLP